MIERLEKMLVDLKATQASGEYTKCPRCGRVELKTPISSNKMSFECHGVYICDDCDRNEEELIHMSQKGSIDWNWSYFKPKTDRNMYKNISIEEFTNNVLPEKAQPLMGVYERWLKDQDNALEYVYQACEAFPGISSVWYDGSFRVAFDVSDGQVIVYFKTSPEGENFYTAVGARKTAQ